jgi:cytochrome c-type biogenesis protein CcmH/NrfF
VKLVLLALAALSLLTAAPALASQKHPTQGELEAMLVCPSCHVPLDESTAPIAQEMKAYIHRRIGEGATRSQIVDELVGPPNNLGVGVLGVPRTHGFDLLAWLLPLGGVGLGALAIGAGAWHWSRKLSEPAGTGSIQAHEPLDPELERRVDEELLRFDG